MTNQSNCTYLLLDLAEDSSDESFALPLPFTSVSWVCLCLEAGEERIVREETTPSRQKVGPYSVGILVNMLKRPNHEGWIR
jgi:hypothetical protein